MPQHVCRHATSPHLFARGSQAQIICFAPGNAGDTYFCQPPRPPGNVLRQSELRCDGSVIEVHRLDYHWTLESGEEYWQRLGNTLATAALAGMVVDLRLTSVGLAHLQACGAVHIQSFSERLAAAANRTACAIISFDCPWDDPIAARLRKALRAAAPHLLIGQRVAVLANLTPDADFAVVRPASAPSGYRDQAAVGFWHHRLGGRPVIFESDTPDPNASLFWFAAGVAGLQHRSFPPAPDPDNYRCFFALRSLSVLLMNLPDGRCPPRPYDAGVGVSLAMGNSGDFSGYLLEPKAAPDILMTSPLIRAEIIGFWFSMARNQSIIEPVQSGSLRRLRPLKQPSNDGWFWGYYAIPRPNDGGSTVTEGSNIPPGPFL